MTAIRATDRYPRASFHPTANQWEGHQGRRAVVLHIAQGGFLSSVKYMNDNDTSAHFVVAKSGSVAQMVSVNDSAWANGLSYDEQRQRWVCPHKHIVVPTWQAIDVEHNPNSQTISIEHEGFSGKTMPAAQIIATVDLLRWLGAQFPSLLPYRVGYTLIGHSHLDPVDKSFCPGPGVDLAEIARRANASSPGPQPAVEPWVTAWGARGIALPPSQISYAIPQLYKFHFAELGACVVAEQYLAPGNFSIAVFERGFIYYLRKTNRAYLTARFPTGVEL